MSTGEGDRKRCLSWTGGKKGVGFLSGWHLTCDRHVNLPLTPSFPCSTLPTCQVCCIMLFTMWR